ncbi:hypothetical protein [Luteococcus peritonei]|uniref:RNA polymerase sigma factor n=1 Tax=Luteococcus peritonei TaxID=88874 RepID=A0ABW4S029_9ACTN
MAFPADKRIALDALIRQEGTELRGTAYLMTGSWPLADELLQHVLAHLVHTGVDLTDRRSALTVARRRLVHLAREPRYRPSSGRPPAAASPQGAHLVAALGTLHLDQRAALVLAWFCRLDDAGIGEVLHTDRMHAAALRLAGVDQLRVGLAQLGDQLVLDDPQPRTPTPRPGPRGPGPALVVASPSSAGDGWGTR